MLKLEERLGQMEKRNEEQDIERAMNGNLVFYCEVEITQKL